MSDPVYNRLQFNGWNFTFYNHETRTIETKNWPTMASVEARQSAHETFPSLEEWIDGMYESWGDVVGKVTDHTGIVLHDNMDEMNEIYDAVSNWP